MLKVIELECPICHYRMELRKIEIEGKEREYYKCYNCGNTIWLTPGVSTIVHDDIYTIEDELERSMIEDLSPEALKKKIVELNEELRGMSDSIISGLEEELKKTEREILIGKILFALFWVGIIALIIIVAYILG